MTRRWRLFPKYALLIITLVGIMLITSGAIGIYFSWQETEADLVALQVEKAQNAAYRIEQYIREIEHELSWTALPRADADGDALESRRIEYLKLQRQAPAITEVVWIDPQGREQLRISRLAMDAIGSGTDFSSDPKFREVASGAVPVYYGPVYFRKGTEPYMTIARAAGSGGGVTAAEVNLKFVWEVVSKIKIGTAGLAYVVDANGVLIAHPDISLVLKKSDLKALPQVAARDRPAAEPSPPGRDLQGNDVFTAHAPIPTLKWTVFVESPRAEAYAPLFASIVRAALLLAAGLVVAGAASFFIARALVRPLQALQQGAARIGAGELEHRIEVKTGDELENLAAEFNKMSSELKESYAGLERKVSERTAELSEALDRQTATSEILRVISESPTDVQPVLEAVAERSRLLCRAEGARIWLPEGDLLRAMTGYKDAGGDSDGRGELLPIRPTSVVGRAFIERRIVHVENVAALVDNEYPDSRALQLSHGFRTILAVPMLREGVSVGGIGLSRKEIRPFSKVEIDLVQTFADQAVIAIENVRLFNETREALEQQTATAEVLRVISASISDAQPVFEKITQSCEQLFAGTQVGINIVGPDGKIHLASYGGPRREEFAAIFPIALDDQSGTGSAIRERRVMHYPDIESADDVPRFVRLGAAATGTRSVIFAPMVLDDRGIGAITVARNFVGPFSANEIALLKTFADQAVIAIENARLFNETQEALERQTATAEVLSVISGSIADSVPVFEKILERCSHLFSSAEQGILLVGDDNRVYLGAHRGYARKQLETMFPSPLGGDFEASILEHRVLHFKDVLGDADVPPGIRAVAERIGIGSYSQAFAPMVWEGRALGTLYVTRQPTIGFSDKELGLLRTFADQAVIAIQNARLFNETREALRKVEQRTAEVSEALDYQTAISDVLRVISQSPTDVSPVFEAILDSASRLFGSPLSAVFRYDGRLVHLAATRNWPAAAIADAGRFYPAPPNPKMLSGRVILSGSVQGEEDALNDPEYDRQAAGLGHWRRMIGAPLLREGQPIGAIIVAWQDPGTTPTRQSDLLKTFADQAVIAIENVRLLSETTEALEQQTATAEVLQVISSSVADTAPVFDKILDSCERLFAATGLGIYLVDGEGLLRKAGFRSARENPERALAGTFPRPLEGTATEIAIRERRVVHYGDILAERDAPAPLVRIAKAAGNFSIAFAPMLWEGRGVGAIQVSRDPPSPFSDKELALLKTFADQAVIAIQNSRLFNEIQAKSRELELANKHKSEFLANMSHELRTPLNAIIGFSEVLSEKMFGEVNDKQLEYLLDIHTSGHHLLSLINDILDLSKIEAGRMELDLATTSLPMLLDNCTTLVRERANRQGLVLSLDVEEGLGDWVADIRKLKQVVINLLSNAVKFTPAGGKVTLRARRLEHAVEIAVVDTGVGIAFDQQALVFEEFRQAGGDYLRKSEGTGLGLSLAKRFVELHGGSMRVESAPGRGATFAFILPERVLEAV
jgi:signal transduction histidine kinase